MESYSVFLISIVSLFTIINAASYQENDNSINWNHEWKPCICPNTSVLAATNEEKKNTTLSVVTAILNTPMPNLTVLGTKYRSILRDLLASPMDNYRQYAALSTNWLSSQLPFLDQKPSGCPMAQLINATVTCVADQDGSKMAPALDLFLTQISSGASLLISTSIAASGCKPPLTYESDTSTNTVPKYECAGSGFVYRIRPIWQRLGSEFPKSLRNIVLMMYRSENYLDKFLAAIATVSLTPSFKNYLANWPFELAFESVSLQSSPPIPECCCEQRLKRINELSNLNKQQSIIQTQGEKNNYASKSSCWSRLNRNDGGSVATASSSAGAGVANSEARAF